MDSIEIIKSLLEKEKMKNTDLARILFDIPKNEAVPAKYRVRISDYLNGKANIPIEILKKIANYFNIDFNYLINSNDNVMPLTRFLPIIGEASCGVPTHQFFEDREMYPVSEDMYRNSRYIVRAVGNSMLPKIKQGDLVLCDTEAQVDNNSIIHYTINGEESGIKKAVYKDGKLFMLMPLNPDYPPIMLGENDEVVTAKCIKVISDL